MSRKVGIILTAIIAVIVGLWLWAGIIPKDSMQIGGSTSVDALMQLLTNTYKDSYHGDSFIYASSGSTGGVNNAKAGSYKIGFISRALDSSTDYVNSSFKSDMKPNDSNYKEYGKQIYSYLIDNKDNKYSGDQMHYVQIASDAIILTYSAPDWFEKNFSPIWNMSTVTDASGKTTADKPWQELVQNIYRGNYTWIDVAKEINKISKKDPNTDIPDNAENATIVPYEREPGSGTRNSFDAMFNMPPKPVDPSKAGGCPSNGVMYDSLIKNSFGYLSLSFIDKIKNNSSLQTVKVNGVDPKTDKTFLADINTANGYTLTRPYIGLFKWDLPNDELKKVSNFLAWIATAVNEPAKKNNAMDEYNGAGLKPEFKLDDSSIPGAPKKAKASESEDTNQTKLETMKTILTGYLPRH